MKRPAAWVPHHRPCQLPEMPLPSFVHLGFPGSILLVGVIAPEPFAVPAAGHPAVAHLDGLSSMLAGIGHRTDVRTRVKLRWRVSGVLDQQRRRPAGTGRRAEQAAGRFGPLSSATGKAFTINLGQAAGDKNADVVPDQPLR
jgi:hypothetical protein